ncbi:MAG: ATP-binding cassette domain-containing protein [Anaeroplasmataceae bacterium]
MIKTINLTRTYKTKQGTSVQALKNVNVEFQDKGLVFILGKSGSGKSTFLNVVGGLDKYDSGEIIIRGKSSAKFSQSDFDSYRNTYVGFIFQEYYILKEFSVGKNIQLAIELQNKKANKKEVKQLLDLVDLTGFYRRKPNELSGGQKQRIAIARALVKNPHIIMADEPTGALDSATGKQVLDTLKKLSAEKLVLVVSHDREFAENYADRIIEFADGEIISDTTRESFESEKATENIEVMDNKIIHFKQGTVLTAADTKIINELISSNMSDGYISLDKESNYKFKRAARISDDDKKETFIATSDKNLTITHYDKGDFKSIKSKLPMMDAFKMGLNSLFSKKIRLFFTIVLAAFAFALFGVAYTASSYDRDTVTYTSLQDNNVTHVGISKVEDKEYQGDKYPETVKMTQKDIDKLKKDNPNMKFSSIYNPSQSAGNGISMFNNYASPASNSELAYYSPNLGGLFPINQKLIDRNNFVLKGKLPENENEIVITNYTAESFIEYGYKSKGQIYKINTIDDMLNKDLEIYLKTKYDFKIVGILDTKIDKERYKALSPKAQYSAKLSQLAQEMQALRLYSYNGLGYVNPTLIENEINKDNEFFQVGDGFFGSSEKVFITKTTLNNKTYQGNHFSQLMKYTSKDYNTIYKTGINKVDDKSVVINMYDFMQIYEDITDEEFDFNNDIKSFLDSQDIKLEISYKQRFDSEEVTTLKLDVVGVIPSFDLASRFEFCMSSENVNIFVDVEIGNFSGVIVELADKDSIANLITQSYLTVDGVRYKMQSIVAPTLDLMNELAEQLASILVWVALGFCIFAGFLLMNFISVSITSKKNDIGILRAIGARSNDITKIFFFESLVISLINFALATGLTIAAIIGINLTINNLGFNITFLNFGIIQILLLLGISILVALIASFLPVKAVTRLRPIDAIKK